MNKILIRYFLSKKKTFKSLSSTYTFCCKLIIKSPQTFFKFQEKIFL